MQCSVLAQSQWHITIFVLDLSKNVFIFVGIQYRYCNAGCILLEGVMHQSGVCLSLCLSVAFCPPTGHVRHILKTTHLWQHLHSQRIYWCFCLSWYIVVMIVCGQGWLQSAAWWLLERLPQQAVPSACQDRVLQKGVDSKCLAIFAAGVRRCSVL